jgi:hypothetical protein
MATDLETLKSEIQAHLETTGMAVFHGVTASHPQDSIYWDTSREPDFRKFLDAAQMAGVKLITFDHDQFTQDEIDEAFESLDDCGFSRDERRQYENRMRELRKYEGFTSRVELSFVLEGVHYAYRMQSDWYNEWLDVAGELDLMSDVGNEDGSDDLPGYFSTN